MARTARRRRAALGALAFALSLTPAWSPAPAQARPGAPSTGRDGRWPVPARASGIVRLAGRDSARSAHAPAAECSLPGGGNWLTDCASTGLPVNETSIAYRDGLFVAGANDYNSYNTISQLGFFWSSDGKRWHDDGFLDLFPHAPDNGAGDPGLAFDSNGVLYYSSISFSYTDCEVGGLELLRRDPATGRWVYRQVVDNTANQFNDKPAIAVDGRNVYQAWTLFDFCPRQQRPHLETLHVAVSPLGPAAAAPIEILTVPGARHTEGASIASDGHGGFWLTWEEFKDNFFTQGQIRLIHHDPIKGWSRFQVISPQTFKDLPIPLPGFRFTTNSFPALAVGAEGPKVVWCSYDSGVGRAYLWSGGQVEAVKDSGGNQFFPAIVARGDRVWVTFSQTNQALHSYGQFLVSGSRVLKVSTKPSLPNQDGSLLHGSFIGDYSSMTQAGSRVVPMWTDVRPPWFGEHTMVYVP